MEARLPQDKLAELQSLLQELSTSRQTTAAKFASFLGKLSFASSVVVPGRTFTRRLWDTAKRFSKVPRHYRITLSQECRRDIQWWQVLVSGWNGKSMFLFLEATPATELGLYTDASGSVGWGAYYGLQGRWIHGQWADDTLNKSIEYKELYAILAACATWGHNWARRRILVHCDNEAIVACLASGTSKSPDVMLLIRSLFLVCARNNFTLSARHVAGKANCIADALSRGLMQVFRSKAPRARPLPDTPAPLPLLQ